MGNCIPRERKSARHRGMGVLVGSHETKRIHAYFHSMVAYLIQEPSTSMKLGGRLSCSFSLHMGKRQGWPLAPTLFTMELIAKALRSSLEIKGLCIGWLEGRMALYAKNLLFFPNDPGPSLQGALNIDTFSEVTGLRVNWMKSQLFQVDPRPEWVPRLISLCNG